MDETSVAEGDDVDEVGLVRAVLLSLDGDRVRQLARRRATREHPATAHALVTTKLRGGWASGIQSLDRRGLATVCSVVSADGIAAIRLALGDRSEDPTLEELREATAAAAATVDLAEIHAALAYAIADAMPAREHAVALLVEEAGVRPVALEPPTAKDTPAAPAVDRAGIAARRKERKLAEQRDRVQTRQQASTQPTIRRRAVAEPPPEVTQVAQVTDAPPSPRVAVDRRAPQLTPRERATYRTDHPLVGTLLDGVPVRYHVDDRDQPDGSSRDRPAIVVGVGSAGLLVRGLYSDQHEWTIEVRGFDGVAHRFRGAASTRWVAGSNEETLAFPAGYPEVTLIGCVPTSVWNQLW